MKKADRDALSAAHQPAGAATVAPDAIPENVGSPDSPEVQSDLMHPEGEDLELSFQTLRIYPLSIARRRRAFGFMTRVMAEAIGSGNGLGGASFALRLASLLNENESIEADLIGHVVRATSQTPFQESQFIKICEEIRDNAEPDDLVKLFGALKKISGHTAPKT